MPETNWTAWLIERRRGGVTSYASFGEFGVEWTPDPLKACHFVRKLDAEQMAYGEDCDAICEHRFGGREARAIRAALLIAAVSVVGMLVTIVLAALGVID